MNTDSSSLLLVDDDELNREGLARRLRRQGYAVALARNGREAVELLGKSRFDLVLLDIMMPGMNGLEVLKFLRRIDSLIDLPIIMVTSRGESDDVVEALELGANDYVTKPVDFPVVLARIRTQLALKRAVAQVVDLEQRLDARNKELEEIAAKLGEVNERITRDLKAAAQIQQAFLPTLPPQVPGVRFAWAFQPCDELAGDLLTLFQPDEQHVGLCVLDVNGQGIAAALRSVTASHLLTQTARPPLASPSQVVGELSKQFSTDPAAERPSTLLYGVLGLDRREFCFVSAGHPGPVHLAARARPALLESTGLPLGVGASAYRDQVVKLQDGDRLFLYSDGVTESRNPDGEHFGSGRLLDSLEGTRDVSLEESLNSLLQDVERWQGNTPRRDDLSILAIEMTGTEKPMSPTAK